MPIPTLVNASGPQVLASAVSVPSGGTDGDIVFLVVSTYGISAASMAAPWVEIGALTSAGTQRYAAFAAPWSAGLSVSLSTTPNQICQITTFLVRGARPISDWVIGTVWPRSGHGTSVTTVAPSVTTVYDDTLVLGAFVERTSAVETDITSVTNSIRAYFFGKDPSSGNIETTTITTKDIATPAASGDVTVQYPNSQSTNGIGQLVAIPGVVAGPTPGLAANDATGAAVEVFYTIDTSGGTAPVADLVMMERGFDTVDQVLATPGVTMAHRGGSGRWPECSLHAYTQSVRRGYGLLEFSVGRSSDGVLFGLHDDTINRTSQTSGLPVASSMSWAEISAYSNTLAVQGAPQPYLTLDEYIAAYGETHVHMFDPKYLTSTQRGELWTQLISEIGVDRIMAKYYGGGPEVAVQATSYGIASWGYFYEADIDGGSFATDKGPWTTYGLPYTAAQSYWDTVLAEGRPIFGHICPNQAAYDLAISKGAFGVQCSGVDQITPVSIWS